MKETTKLRIFAAVVIVLLVCGCFVSSKENKDESPYSMMYRYGYY